MKNNKESKDDSILTMAMNYSHCIKEERRKNEEYLQKCIGKTYLSRDGCIIIKVTGGGDPRKYSRIEFDYSIIPGKIESGQVLFRTLEECFEVSVFKNMIKAGKLVEISNDDYDKLNKLSSMACASCAPIANKYKKQLK